MTIDEPRVGILTGERYPDLFDDGKAIAATLEDRGVRADPIVWSAAGDLDAYDAVLVRSCWDYHTDPTAFREFLTTLERSDPDVYNPPSVMRWNAHKSYYRDLEAAGVPIPPSVCVEAGTDVALESILRQRGWTEAVVKPAVGASSTGVWRTSLDDVADDQSRFEAACADRDVVVQQFAPEIERGERSIVFVRGEYSHAWNDPTKPDDFSDFEEADDSYEPHDDLRSTARSVLETACDRLECAPSDLSYARVDYVERDGRLLLMELELIEPYLGLVREDGALERFVDAFESLALTDLESVQAITDD
ncbi:ATP-grasp domain-containing protein [Natrarchaeobaculum aegyptiacum]|uniref:ATP-grasp domain-containing protein n=1 Tax=Natrarchaeobaculum aegyptiacum TaxID=745377 RepID=A0A2Z2HSP4_9EURY|nr:hypothetical protein [Natrarchaeobaculum aegyptiacum]ARS90179.1 hypothetical protein B1756_10890 [Natrarchaeobaculum aegyptiacum]